MNTETKTLLGKVLYSPHVAQTLARHKTAASNGRLLHDLIKFGPEERSPAQKLEEWRTIALLATKLNHASDSNKNLGDLLKPGKRSEDFLEKLQKASGPRAAKLIAQQVGNFKEETVNLYWIGVALLNWPTQKKEVWVRWAKTFYLSEGEPV